jgi:hypothetical protein
VSSYVTCSLLIADRRGSVSPTPQISSCNEFGSIDGSGLSGDSPCQLVHVMKHANADVVAFVKPPAPGV